MATIIPLRPSGARAGDHRPPATGLSGVGTRLLGAIAWAIRHELARRELSRLDDRSLRDIGADRVDAVPAWIGPLRTPGL